MSTLHAEVQKMTDNRLQYMIKLCTEELLRRLMLERIRMVRAVEEGSIKSLLEVRPR